MSLDFEFQHNGQTVAVTSVNEAQKLIDSGRLTKDTDVTFTNIFGTRVGQKAASLSGLTWHDVANSQQIDSEIPIISLLINGYIAFKKFLRVHSIAISLSILVVIVTIFLVLIIYHSQLSKPVWINQNSSAYFRPRYDTPSQIVLVRASRYLVSAVPNGDGWYRIVEGSYAGYYVHRSFLSDYTPPMLEASGIDSISIDDDDSLFIYEKGALRLEQAEIVNDDISAYVTGAIHQDDLPPAMRNSLIYEIIIRPQESVAGIIRYIQARPRPQGPDIVTPAIRTGSRSETRSQGGSSQPETTTAATPIDSAKPDNTQSASSTYCADLRQKHDPGVEAEPAETTSEIGSPIDPKCTP